MATEKEGVRLDTEKLDDLIRAFSGKMPSGKVGILGSKTIRSDDSAATNAEIGARHEFGTGNTKKRSFLRMPLMTKLGPALERSGAFDPRSLERVIKERSIYTWMKRIMIIAVDVVLEAFATGGYGVWKPSDMTRKKVHLTLVETQQLRNSITEEVE